MNALSVVWFASAIGGALAAGLALAVPSLRRAGLLTAGTGFAIAGVLGIFSIGIFFAGFAAICFTKAAKLSEARALPTTPPPPPPA